MKAPLDVQLVETQYMYRGVSSLVLDDVIKAYESKCAKFFMKRILDNTKDNRITHQHAINESIGSILLSSATVTNENLHLYQQEYEKIKKIQQKYNPLKICPYQRKIKGYIQNGLDPAIFELSGMVDVLVGSKLLDKINLIYFTQLSMSDESIVEYPIQNVEGQWSILSQGEWLSLSDLNEIVRFDELTKDIVSRDNPNQVWNFVSPKGFIPVLKGDVVPVMKLSWEEFHPILEHAKQSTVSPGLISKDLNCVIQFQTSIRRSFIPDWRIFDNFVNQMPNHLGVRLFIKNGDSWDLYCPGFEQDRVSQADIMSRLPFSFFETSKISYSVLDFEEYRMYSNRHIGSLPITENIAKSILNLFHNTKGCSFNFVRQNCSKLGERVVNLFEDVSFKVNLLDLCFHSLPSIEDLPFMRWIKPLKEYTFQWIQAASDTIDPLIPSIAKKIFNEVLKVLLFIPWKILVFGINFAFYVFGGRTSILGDHYIDPVDDNYLNRFKLAIDNFLSLFSDQTMTICHPKVLLKWLQNKNALFTHNKPRDEPLYMAFSPAQKV